MPDEAEMEMLAERLTGSFGYDIIKLKGGIYHGTAKQTEVMGALDEHGGSDRISGENILQD